jgi:hypothetical protein
VVAVLAGIGRADHSDSPSLADNPMADITDVYAWMTGSNLNLIMNVSPRDDGTHSFGSSVLYVFHVTSKSGLGVAATTGTETRVICRFDSNTSVGCWVVSGAAVKDYVTGDPSAPSGVTSLLGRVKVFAGRRSDPFFFNQAGLGTAIASYKALTGLTPDGAGCPNLDAGQATNFRTQIGAGSDGFATANVMAIVVQVDKSLVNTVTNATVVGVWGSTHAGT